MFDPAAVRAGESPGLPLLRYLVVYRCPAVDRSRAQGLPARSGGGTQRFPFTTPARSPQAECCSTCRDLAGMGNIRIAVVPAISPHPGNAAHLSPAWVSHGDLSHVCTRAVASGGMDAAGCGALGASVGSSALSTIRIDFTPGMGAEPRFGLSLFRECKPQRAVGPQMS
jgi:hypothetical protein